MSLCRHRGTDSLRSPAFAYAHPKVASAIDRHYQDVIYASRIRTQVNQRRNASRRIAFRKPDRFAKPSSSSSCALEGSRDRRTRFARILSPLAPTRSVPFSEARLRFSDPQWRREAVSWARRNRRVQPTFSFQRRVPESRVTTGRLRFRDTQWESWFHASQPASVDRRVSLELIQHRARAPRPNL
jgi:hypothetical protein